MYYLDLHGKIYGRFQAVFMIAMAMVAAIIIMLIIRGIWNVTRSGRTKYVARAVKITTKRREFTNGTGEQASITATDYYVTYLLADGEEVEFRVPRDIYDESIKGNTGYLLYQGNRFLAFKTTY